MVKYGPGEPKPGQEDVEAKESRQDGEGVNQRTDEALIFRPRLPPSGGPGGAIMSAS